MAKSTAAPAEESELAERLRKTISAFVRTTRAHTNTIKSAQSETLDLLLREGAMSVAQLAQRRKVKHQSARLTVSQLEVEGLVRKEANPSDGRSQLIVLTKTGRSSVMKGRKLRAAWIEEALSRHFSQEERRCLIKTLTALERVVEAYPVGYKI